MAAVSNNARRALRGLVSLGFAVLCATPATCVAVGEYPDRAIYPSGSSAVEAVIPAGEIDLVIFEDGVESGFQTGMKCRVSSGGEKIAEVIIAAVVPGRAVALILDFNSEERIEVGDAVEIKAIL